MNDKSLDNTYINDNKTKERVIVEFSMDILANNPEISTKLLCEELSKIEELRGYNKDFLAMSTSTIEHYKNCAMIFNR